MKALAKIIIIVAIFIVGFYFGTQQVLSPTDNSPLKNEPNNQPPSTSNQDVKKDNQAPSIAKDEIKASLMIDFGNGQIKTFNQQSLAKDSTVLDLLKKVATDNSLPLEVKDYGEMGVFIESINNIKSDFKTDKFWQYWVNNEYSKLGASIYQLKNGDVVEWKFIAGQID